ncbi:MAG: hypothetical protein AAF203_05880 [Pseudomonadota bacterium]
MRPVCVGRSFNNSPQGSAVDCDGDGILNDMDTDDTFKADFVGAGGSAVTSFSEVFNRLPVNMTFNCAANTTDSDGTVCHPDEISLGDEPQTSRPQFSFLDFPSSARPESNRYFQYKLQFEAEENRSCSDDLCLPELSSLSLLPGGRYYSGSPDITNVQGQSLVAPIRRVEVDASTDCDLRFQLSLDGVTDYYWNGSAWAPGSGVEQSNDLETLNGAVSSFTRELGIGTLSFRIFMGTTSFSSCEIRSLQVHQESQ